MKKMWNKSYKRRSMSASSKLSASDDHRSFPDSLDGDSSSSHVRALIDAEYDTRTVKHAWLNGFLNASPMQDFKESSLRLYRVELRGSHLYIYRPPLLMNVRLFKFDLEPPSASGAPASDIEVASLATTEQGMSSVAKTELHSMGESTAVNSTSTFASTSDLASLNENFITHTTNTKGFMPSSISCADNISYFLPTVPHPELKLDPTSGTFNSSSSMEALVHFFIFADGKTESKLIRHLITIFPLLPKFGDALKLVHMYLHAIYSGKIEGFVPTPVMWERVFSFLQHINENFNGFLLKSDVASFIPKILRCLSSANLEKFLESISELQKSIVANQQKLLGLIGQVDSAVSASLASILAELNAHNFMHDVNLLELVGAVCGIDLLFFRTWNSSSDKSLLLSTSASENSPGDSFYKKNSLFFNNRTHMHYLSRLFVHHLFVENLHSAPEKLARLIERWIDLGCLLHKSGNMSSWLGIAAIILSQPVLRLSTIWSHVGDDYIKLLRTDWSPVLFELDRRHITNTNESLMIEVFSIPGDKSDIVNLKESYHIMAPRGLGKIYPKEEVVPYFGDLLLNNAKSSDIVELETIWRKISCSFERWNDYLNNICNSPEVILYNQDVLRRFDSMGFIFSNDSLNQALYLDVNRDDENCVPLLPKFTNPDAVPANECKTSSGDLRGKLLRLLELNCESIDLCMVMDYSLRLEPCLIEGHLEPLVHAAAGTFLENGLNNNSSSVSLDSSLSAKKLKATEVGDTFPNCENDSRAESATNDLLPTFSLEYYKINFAKYDDLFSLPRENLTQMSDAHNIVVDKELVLRLDDFVCDPDSSVTPAVSISEINRATDGEEGLDIDVDDMMNKHNFKGLSIMSEVESADEKKHRSFGLSSLYSSPGVHSGLERYIPRFASMDKLIDLLLIDWKYFDENHPIDLRDYRIAFMLNYSSFITTKKLLEKLAHRFIHSGDAVISVMKRQYLKKHGTYDPTTFGVFPQWVAENDMDLSQLGEVDYELLLQIQANILKVLSILLNGSFEKFFKDLANKDIMIKILKLYSNEVLQWYNSNKIDKKLNGSFELLVELYKKVKKLFIRKSYRPVDTLKFNAFLNREFKFSRSLREVPMNRNLPSHRNIHKVEKFLNKFNKLLGIFYQGITAEDWFAIFSVLETMFVNRSLLNYDLQRLSTPEKVLRISDVFTFFDVLPDSNSEEKVLDKFPLVFKKLYYLYLKFKAYLLIQLCDETITAEERLERMKTLLVMLQVSRLKMKDSRFVFDGDSDVIPSCIETAITSVIYSPESRSLSSSWLKSSTSMNENGQIHVQKYDDVESLLPSYITQSDLLPGSEPLLPCFGWIIQNLIHLNKCPSFHRSTINFNKRYLLFKLIKELKVEGFKTDELHKETREFEFLLNLDETRMFPISSSVEAANNGSLFLTVIRKQYAILTNDENMRHASEKCTSLFSRQVHTTNSLSNVTSRRQSLAYKTTSSSRFKLSSLFNKSRSFGYTSTYERVVAYGELPEPAIAADPRQKPVLVIQLKDRKIFPVYLLPFCFKFDTNTPSEACFFQASNESKAKEWLRILNYANRHWFLSRSINSKDDHSHTSFGMPLATICARDGTDCPAVLNTIYSAIESDGLKEVGIYRISTSLSELSSMKQEINRTGTINLKGRTMDVHTLTSCVKLFFRELPDALLTDDVIELLCLMKRPGSEKHEFTAEDARAYKKVLSCLPRVNYCTLRALARHLSIVVKENDVNKMTCSNLATVIGPALTEASNLESLINNFGAMNHMLEKLIDNYLTIFEQDSAEVVKVMS